MIWKVTALKRIEFIQMCLFEKVVWKPKFYHKDDLYFFLSNKCTYFWVLQYEISSRSDLREKKIKSDSIKFFFQY